MLAAATTRHLTIIDPSIARRGPASLAPTSDLPSPPTTSTWSPDSTSLYIASANTITRYDALGELIKTVHVHTPADKPIASLLAKDKGTLIYAAGSTIHILEHSASQSATSRVVQTLTVSAGPDAGPLAALSLSNDGTLLVTAAARAVLVHNLSLGSQTVLRGLPLDEGERISACVLHAHSRIRLFLGIGRQLVVYDVTRPAGPVRLVPMSESATGEIVAIACSPYSKTLLAVACSDGHVALVDLDKEQGRIRSFNYKVPLTSLVFSPDGATLYIGTETGKLLVQTLRSMEPPKMIVVGENGDRVENLIIAKKTKASEAAAKLAASKPLVQHDVNMPRRPSIKVSVSGENTSAKPDVVMSPPTKTNPRTRVLSGASKPDAPPRKRLTSIVSALGRRIASSKTPEGGTSGEDDGPVKVNSPVPLVRRTRTTSLRAQLAASRGADAAKNDDASNPPSTVTSPIARKPPSRPPSRPPVSRYKSTLQGSAASTSAATINAEETSAPMRKRTVSATSKSTTSALPGGLEASQLSPIRTRTLSAPKSPSSLAAKSPLGSKSGSTSTLSRSPTAPVRSRTTSALSRASIPDAMSQAGPSAPATTRTRTASTLTRTTSSGSASTHTASSTSTRARTTSSTSRTSVARTCSPAPPLPRVAEGRTQAPRAASLRTPSPELMEPSLIKEAAPFPLMDDETPQKRGKGMLGMTTPEVQRWIDAGKGKERDKETEQDVKQVEFAPGDDEPEEFTRLEIRLKEIRADVDGDDEVDAKLKEKEAKLRRSLSMEMTPRRVPSASSVPSPLRHSFAAATPGVQGAQNLLHAMIRDAMVDYQQESKAEMVGLHLDLLRMGRAWRQEMRATMEEYGRDLRELREENKRLREENERLRRGY